MKKKWLTAFPKTHQPTYHDAESFLPDPDYLHVFLAQMVRHYEPQFIFEFNDTVGWYLIARYKERQLFTIYIYDYYFATVVEVAQSLDTLLEPMLIVMSDQVNQIFEGQQVLNGVREFKIEIKSEKEMEDTVYLISLRAKTIREGN